MDLSRGILTGCDKNMELFLPWWFDHLQKHNDFPVAILDYGLSEWGKRVAQKIGTLIEPKAISLKDYKHKHTDAFPEHRYKARSIYMYKPFGLKQSPFEHTIWLDVDIKVQKSIKKLFSTPYFGIIIGDSNIQQWAKESAVLKHPEMPMLASGTLVFKKDCPVIEAWAQKTLEDGGNYVVEDVLLSELLSEGTFDVSYLSDTYNKRWQYADDDTHIAHYLGIYGKTCIVEEIMIKVLGAPDEQ